MSVGVCLSLSLCVSLSLFCVCVCVSHRRDCFSRLCQGKSEDVSQTKKVEFLSFSQKEENSVKNLYCSKTRQNGNIVFGIVNGMVNGIVNGLTERYQLDVK